MAWWCSATFTPASAKLNWSLVFDRINDIHMHVNIIIAERYKGGTVTEVLRLSSVLWQLIPGHAGAVTRRS